jgi:hypothetical protein
VKVYVFRYGLHVEVAGLLEEIGSQVSVRTSSGRDYVSLFWQLSAVPTGYKDACARWLGYLGQFYAPTRLIQMENPPFTNLLDGSEGRLYRPMWMR